MAFSPALFNRHLRQIGQDIKWRQAFACPCVNPASGAAKPGCPLCRGKSWQWAAEVDCRVGLQMVNNKKGFAAFGQWEPGDALLTIGSDQACYAASHMDRFRALNSTSTFSVNLTRGDSDIVRGTIQSISRVFWTTADGNAIVDGGIPVVNADGTFTWPDNDGPADGKVYSITGVRYDEFFAYMQIPSNRPMSAGAALPKKLPVRKLDLFSELLFDMSDDLSNSANSGIMVATD